MRACSREAGACLSPPAEALLWLRGMSEQHDALPCEPYQPYEAVHHTCLEQAVPELQTRATDASERQLSAPTVRTALSDAAHVSSPDQGAGHARTLAGLTVSLSVTLARQYQSKHHKILLGTHIGI